MGMPKITDSYVAEILPKALAADFACSPADLVGNGHCFVVAGETEGRRRFPFRVPALYLVTMGYGVVVSASEERLPWLRERLSDQSRDGIFSSATLKMIGEFVGNEGQCLAGPNLKYVCSIESFRDYSPPDGITVETAIGADIKPLRSIEGFPHAVQREPNQDRPEVLAVVASQSHEVVGLASVSADNDVLYQIGVDVAANVRGQGVGKAIVATATREILDRGAIPYYSTAVSNVASNNIALSVGFRLTWVEVYVWEVV